MLARKTRDEITLTPPGARTIIAFVGRGFSLTGPGGSRLPTEDYTGWRAHGAAAVNVCLQLHECIMQCRGNNTRA